MKKILFSFGLALFAFSLNSLAQLRPVEKTTAAKSDVRTVAPISFTAKYEGGVFGFDDKQEGSLKFDDVNERLIFFGKDQKEKFSIPYKAMLIVSPQTRSVRSAAGTAISVIPLPGAGLAGLIREKRRYLAVSYSDPDVAVRGLANFKLQSKEMLESVIQTLGEKAKLVQRGDAYYRPRGTSAADL